MIRIAILTLIFSIQAACAFAGYVSPVPGPASGMYGSTFRSFSSAYTSSVTAGKNIIVDAAMTVNGGTTPTDRALQVLPGGSLNVAAGKTLYINSPFSAGAYRAFTGSGTVVFGPGSVAEVLPEWFYNGSGDWHDAILAAVKAAYTVGGRPVKFSAQTYTTSPIDFTNLGLKNVTLKGVGGNSAWNSQTKILFTGTTGVGFQFASTQNPMTTDYSKSVIDAHIQDMIINCGASTGGDGYYSSGGVPVCVNGNNGLHMTRVVVTGAATNGIQIEDYGWPVKLDDVESSFNGLNGIYVRGPNTTKWSMHRVRTTNNKGYGIVVEGWANSTIVEAVIQTNKTGGLKIYTDTTTYPGTYYHTNLSIKDMYFEQNGKVGNGNPGYEGDYAMVIDSADQTSSTSKCPYNITVENFHIYKSSTAGSGVAKINRVNTLNIKNSTFDAGTIGTDLILGQYAYGIVNNGTYVDQPGNLITNNDRWVQTYNTMPPELKGQRYAGLWMPSRGKTQTLYFYLPDIAAGQTVFMNTAFTAIKTANAANIYKMFKEGSIIGNAVHKLAALGGSPAGTLTFKPKWTDYGNGWYINPGTEFAGYPTLTLNVGAGEFNAGNTYSAGINAFPQYSTIGIEVTASSDYVSGTYKDLMYELVIEY